uniref:Uncharacterized protein n=1 Tax=Hyaloperonospora arabidopsidis (strain Emoy2) TaxID=559515 RepID=M4B6C3_HYAAE
MRATVASEPPTSGCCWGRERRPYESAHTNYIDQHDIRTRRGTRDHGGAHRKATRVS